MTNSKWRIVRHMSRASEKLIFAPETYQYGASKLDKLDLGGEPIEFFHKWYKEAIELKPEGSKFIPESVTFSTARLPSGRVSSRVVLLKELDNKGFVLYSNWDKSKKSLDVNSNKFGSLNFFWPYLERQVRVEGIIEKVDTATSQKYFDTRPRGSRIGAWASPQSQPLESRNELDLLVEQIEKRFQEEEHIPVPEFWGGIRIVPLEIEFWQGRVSRLHDRISFTREDIEAPWKAFRLAP